LHIGHSLLRPSVARTPDICHGRPLSPELNGWLEKQLNTMLFQSQVFVLLFLPFSLLAYYAVCESETLRHWTLILTSLLFYAWWDVRFLPLLVGQIALTWFLTELEARFKLRALLGVGIAANLLSLAIFKYLGFLTATFTAITGFAVSRIDPTLPIGISFFSFQLISYLIDRMRGNAPRYPFRPFALFVLLFPHLIAGPIVRHNELIPQFRLSPLRDGLWQRIGVGLVIFTMGFVKKVLLADELGRKVDPLFAQLSAHGLNFAESWSATLGFSLQLFLDFSAYTEMAIGVALLYGLILPENFKRPYLSVDLREFWQRWHMTLSRFIRDYLYIPMGGSKHGPARYVLATMGSMAICGLWHGAGWMFVLWGLWHGMGLVVCRGWKSLDRPMPRGMARLITLTFVGAGWIIFRSADPASASSLLMSLFGAKGFTGTVDKPLLYVAGALASILVPSAHEIIEGLKKPYASLAVGGSILAILTCLDVGRGAPVNFIYFQF
jgi:alginate O-acetyltransferase complex protein AlgI